MNIKTILGFRRCPQCKRLKRLSADYYTDKRKKYGYSSWCKECIIKKVSLHYRNMGSEGKSRLKARMKEWQREYDSRPEVKERKKLKMLNPEYREKRHEYVKNYRKSLVENGKYGKCIICKNNLGRNEGNKTNICKNCMKGENSPNYKGGYLNTEGYRIVRNNGHTILEHRLVMEKHLGRKLYKDETIHHINGKRDDNRIENLELWVGAQTKGVKKSDALNWAREIIKRYE
jgi:glutaredoxin